MGKPASLANERARIEAVERLNLLDTPPEERFDRYTRLAQKLFDVPIVAIGLLNSRRQWFKSRIGMSAEELPREATFCTHTIESDKALVVSDAASDKRFRDHPMVTATPHVRFYAGAPLLTPRGFRLGSLCLADHKPRQLSADDISTLQDLAAMVVDEMFSNIDELTRLTNLRGFLTAAAHALAQSRRQDWPTTLAMFDLDGFKAINDRFGHNAGNNALTVFADSLRGVFRRSDIISRVGGDEFCVLMPQSTPSDALVCLKRLASSLDKTNKAANIDFRLEFSVGMAQYDSQLHPTVQELFEAADRAMYESKRKKRAPEDGPDGPGPKAVSSIVGCET